MPEGEEQGIAATPASLCPAPAPVTEPAVKVFVSYASQDAAIANALVAALEHHGVSCWIAPRDVIPGEFYADAIVRAIDAARALVLLLSQSAAASPHILREVERASSKRHPVISLRIDRAPLPPGLEYFLNTSQWLDAADSDPRRAFPKLIDAVRPALTGAAADPRITLEATRPPARSSKRSRAVAVVAALSIVALVLFAIDRIRASKRPASAHQVHPTAPATSTPTTVAAAAFTPPPHSIAVLPFVNMSGDPKQEYFSDGISEELLNSLSRLNDLQVVARTSSFSFKGQYLDVSTIAHKLNVGNILEGSVRSAGNTVRITAQLINTVTGFHIWSQTYDRRLTDVLRVQSDVAAAVAQQLDITLLADETAKLDSGTKNPEAYEAYLKGAQLVANWDLGEPDLRAALSELDRAIALDPNFALAYERRAIALNDKAVFVAKPSEIAGVRAQAAESAERALALAPELADAHLTLATVYAYGLLDFARAAPEYDRALALAPGSARVQRGVAEFAGQLGRFETAIAAARRAVSLDPQNPDAYVTLGRVLTWAREYREALSTLQTAQLLRPDSIYVRAVIADALLGSGEFDQAQTFCESPPIPPTHPIRQWCLAIAYHGLGHQSEAKQEAEKFQAEHPDAAVETAGIYAQWGDSAGALRSLAQAERQRDPALQGLRVWWALDPIRHEPEFKAILSRMNLPP